MLTETIVESGAEGPLSPGFMLRHMEIVLTRTETVAAGYADACDRYSLGILPEFTAHGRCGSGAGIVYERTFCAWAARLLAFRVVLI